MVWKHNFEVDFGHHSRIGCIFGKKIPEKKFKKMLPITVQNLKKRITSSLSIHKNWWLILARFPQIALFCWSGGCDLRGSGQNNSWFFVREEGRCVAGNSNFLKSLNSEWIQFNHQNRSDCIRVIKAYLFATIALMNWGTWSIAVKYW